MRFPERPGVDEYVGVTHIPPRGEWFMHHHMCPDGTRVRVLAQRIAVTDAVIHKWVVGGEWWGSNPARTPVGVPPSWVVIDAQHSAREVA